MYQPGRLNIRVEKHSLKLKQPTLAHHHNTQQKSAFQKCKFQSELYLQGLMVTELLYNLLP